VRQLYPDVAADVDPAIVYADLPDVKGRPSVRLNMIVSVDGGTAWNGMSGALGGPADKALFGVLRSFPDIILVASGTMRAEDYGPAILPEAVRDTRLARGQSEVPAIAVVSSTCDFDWSTPFFTKAVERPLILTVASASAENRARAERAADVIIAGEREVDLASALGALSERGATNVLAEGGPTLNGQLASAGLLDEVCVTLSPTLASGDAKRLISGSPLAMLERLHVRSICEQDDYLFLRYRPTT
jgi:riboflavin biosynthesis pyrimidine reductase